GAGPRRQALAALCVTEIASYGVIYYAFPVLATHIAAGTGWSRAAVTAAYSAGNLAGAVAGIPVGRLLQKYGPRPVMTAAGVLGAVSVAGIAAAPSYGWFTAAWLAAGIASAGLFYPPAFAALTGWYGPQRVRALTTLTLAAGFASTIFAPLASALAAHLSWRGTYLTLAAVLAVTIPAHALFLRPAWTRWGDSRAPEGGRDRQVLASRAFLQMTAAGTLCAFAQYAALVNLVPLLEGRGLSASLAAWGLGLGGAGQVAGRLCYRSLAASRLGTRGRTAAIIAAGGAATLLLGLLPGPAALLVAVSVIAGAVRGVFTLTEATLVSDYWGPDRYAVLNGVFNAPLVAAGAIAPAAGAGIAAAAGSYPALFAVLAVTAAVGATLAASAPSPDSRAKAPGTSGSVREPRGELPDTATELG
ncbi:MAG TPA: MFS transporter, partial [Streptosporangiaceae bacterium]